MPHVPHDSPVFACLPVFLVPTLPASEDSVLPFPRNILSAFVPDNKAVLS